jgi:lysozyme
MSSESSELGGMIEVTRGISMKRIVAVVSLGILMVGSAAWAQDKPLVDDASRAQLFGLMRAYLQAAAPAESQHLYAFPRMFNFPIDTKWSDAPANTKPRANQIFGIDLSHHNSDACKPRACVIDWRALANNNVHYAYLKVSQGVGSYDSYFDTYRNAARNLPADKRIYVGPYHFLSSSDPGKDQAIYFLKLINHKLASDDLPPTLDLEWDVRVKNHKVIMKNGEPYDFWLEISKDNPKRRGDKILDEAVAWLDAVAAATKRTPAVYTNKVWWGQAVGDETKIARLSKYLIWIADYSKTGLATEKTTAPGNSAWTIWQFTDSARTPSGGITVGHTVDANVFDGSQGDFQKTFGLIR